MLAALALMTGESAPQVSSRSPAGGLPGSVAATTRKQIQDYLGNTDLKGVPLLDPSIDWDKQSNWPDQFAFQGHRFKLDIRDLTNNGFKQLRSRSEIKPSMTVNFWYLDQPPTPDPRNPNAISPRATWTPGKRVADKHMMWGGTGDAGESARDIFAYTFYPAGTLFRAHWQQRATAWGEYQVFDRDGNLVASHRGTNYFWNGIRTERYNFFRWSEDLYRSDGVISRVSGDARSSPRMSQRPGVTTNRPRF